MLEPTADNVMLEIITRQEELAKTTSFLLPGEMKQDEPDRGRILAIGPGVPPDWPGRVGDLVIYHTKEVFQGFRLDGKDMVFMHADEILAKITEEVA